MAPLMARAILWFVFAFILFDTFKAFNQLFTLSLNPYFAIAAAALVYGFQEFMIKKWTADESAVPTGKAMESNVSKIFHVIIWIIAVGLFLGILMVWIGVIYKAIIKG